VVKAPRVWVNMGIPVIRQGISPTSTVNRRSFFREMRSVKYPKIMLIKAPTRVKAEPINPRVRSLAPNSSASSGRKWAGRTR